MSKSEPPSHESLYSVGRLAQATGISPDTLRVWERRYGTPKPIRLESGHRRYTEQDVRRLRRIAEGISRGLRPGTLLRVDEVELERLINEAGEFQGAALDRWSDWFERIRAWDAPALHSMIESSSANKPAVVWVDEVLAPFLTAVGRAWADGELEVAHEHFVSNLLEDHLRHKRLVASLQRKSAYRARIVLAALAEEDHDLPLQMVGLVSEEAGVQARILGTRTPLPEIVRAAQETRAEAVGVSVSLANAGPRTDRTLTDLRRELPERVQLVTGGGGRRYGRRGPRGIKHFENARSFDEWLAGLRAIDA